RVAASTTDLSPEAAAKAVVDAYQAALTQLNAAAPAAPADAHARMDAAKEQFEALAKRLAEAWKKVGAAATAQPAAAIRRDAEQARKPASDEYLQAISSLRPCVPHSRCDHGTAGADLLRFPAP